MNVSRPIFIAALSLMLFIPMMVLAQQGPVKQSAEKVRITNATPEVLVFVLVPTTLSLINGYSDRYADVMEYFLNELLPGQSIFIPKLERSLKDYDRVLWIVNAEKKAYLNKSLMAGEKRDKKYVSAIPVGSAKEVIIDGHGDVFRAAKDSVAIRKQAAEFLRVGNIAAKSCGGSIPQLVNK
jgi:hypothetical protein